MTLTNLLFLIAGGAIGTVARYYVSIFSLNIYSGLFPLGTLLVNAAGSFFIGFLFAIFAERDVTSSLRLFLFIGLLGSFTTFSAFSLETLNLFRGGEVRLAILNILANNVISILFVVAGFFLARLIFAVK